MKGYFIYFERKEQYGVRKKVAGQIKALSAFSEVIELNILEKSSSRAAKIKARIPIWGYGYDYDSAFQEIVNPDYIYMRHTMVDQDLISFLGRIKGKFPKVKVIDELYTYPYDKDFYMSKTMWPLYLKERLFRCQLHKYINRFVTLTNDDIIFGVKTIKTVNGIDLDIVPFNEPEQYNGDTIRLMSIAVMQKHHGFERLIEGLHQYYEGGGKRSIVYTAVGDKVGLEVEKYVKMTEEYGLGSHVVFTGSKRGAELDRIMKEADIGICSLGSYKLGIDASSQLKSREYLAAGLPMLTGCRIDVLDGSGFPYYIEFPNDSSPIDMGQVVEFYDRVYLHSGKSRSEIAHEIREFAENTVDVKKVMEPVHDYIVSK